jgi:hypothetical protein
MSHNPMNICGLLTEIAILFYVFHYFCVSWNGAFSSARLLSVTPTLLGSDYCISLPLFKPLTNHSLTKQFYVGFFGAAVAQSV